MIICRHVALTHKPDTMKRTAVSTKIEASPFKSSDNSNGAYSSEEMIQLMLIYLPDPKNKNKKAHFKMYQKRCGINTLVKNMVHMHIFVAT